MFNVTFPHTKANGFEDFYRNFLGNPTRWVCRIGCVSRLVNDHVTPEIVGPELREITNQIIGVCFDFAEFSGLAE